MPSQRGLPTGQAIGLPHTGSLGVNTAALSLIQTYSEAESGAHAEPLPPQAAGTVDRRIGLGTYAQGSKTVAEGN